MMPAFICRIFVISILFFGIVLSQSIEDEFNNPCSSATTCGECIQISRLCAWCASESVARDYSRCDLEDNIKSSCNAADIFNPKTDFKPERDAEWTSGGPDTPPIQVKPQALTFDIRTNDPVTFKLKFRQQSNYPVDLYFLLDLSFGMYRQEEARKRLIALGSGIRASMTNLTNNFKLGFGTFVDKLLMPYTAWTPKMLQDRCPLKGNKCRQPHDFRHQVNLGEDNDAFADKMKAAMESVSQSLDDAEGGLDGLIQALACDLIGWREVSRRIIVYSSNSLFHLAGAGKLGGATKQSDLGCDLNSEGEYAGEKIYDYPSVSQIANKLHDKNANVIFAVMSNVTRHYKMLETFLDGAVVGELEQNSKNIVELIRAKYYELRSQIIFKSSNADGVKLTMKSKCTGNVMKETNRCDNLEIEEAVEFDVTMSVSDDICEGKSGIVKKRLQLDAVGLNEQLVIDLNVMCSCQCQTPENEHREKCSNAGVLECGICSCDSNMYGKQCECDQTQISSQESFDQCRMNNQSAICSGKGDCVCGECKCWKIPNEPKNAYSGTFCNCNNFNCPLGKNRKPCAGHGSCKCSKCSCDSGWSGPTCECSTDKEQCMAKNGLECNGMGVCECGTCSCNATLKMFGPTCEDCPTCALKCSEYRDCAQCKAHGTGTFDIDECKKNCPTTVVKDDLPRGKDIRRCDGYDVDGCKFFFTYQYSPSNKVIIVSQQTKDCPTEANMEALIGGIVAAVVIIPLFVICLVIILRNKRDAKEYADFMRESQKATWDATSNPIYKDPKSTFQNPTYRAGKK